jgi:hypothetical protein
VAARSRATGAVPRRRPRPAPHRTGTRRDNTHRPITVHVRSYRPARRAVLAITTGPHHLFAKVVPPRVCRGLRIRHELVSARASGTHAAGHDRRRPRPHAGPPGLLGTDGSASRTPPARRGSAGEPPRSSPRRPHHTARSAGLPTPCPALRRRARPHGAAEGRTVPGWRRSPTRSPKPSRRPPQWCPCTATSTRISCSCARTVTGLLDVDTAGPGHRIDDWATLLAHLTVLDTPASRDWARSVLRHVEGRFEPEKLRPRVASAVLGLATGPFRTQRPTGPIAPGNASPWPSGG